ESGSCRRDSARSRFAGSEAGHVDGCNSTRRHQQTRNRDQIRNKVEMSKQPRFWLNVALIGLAHVALITGLIRWNAASKNSASHSIVWINSSSGGADGAAPVRNYGSVPTPPETWTPPPEASQSNSPGPAD